MMLRVGRIACAASISLAFCGAQALAQPTPQPQADSSGPAGEIEGRIAAERANLEKGECGPQEIERIEAINRDAIALAKSVQKALLVGAPLERTNGKAAYDAAKHAAQLLDDARKGCERPPAKKTPAEQPGDTIVPQPPLAPSDVLPGTVPATETAPPIEQQLERRLAELQDNVRNSYCVTPELQKQMEDLRRDLDKATMGLDMTKPVDRYRLSEHEKLSRELTDLDKAMRKLPQGCPKNEKISPVDGPARAGGRFPPATTPLGGTDLGVNCSEKDRTDERLKVQGDLLKLEDELIKTDGTTPTGRARQIELQRQIKQINDLIDTLKRPCPPRSTAKTENRHDISDDLGKSSQLVDVGETSHQKERPLQPGEPPPTADGRFPPPTTALGGKQPGGCTETERTDARLRLQEDVLKLEAELIRTDGTTLTGRARQAELQREITHDTDEMDRLRELCPREIGAKRTKLPDLTEDIGKSNELVDIGETPARSDRPAQAQRPRDDCQAAEGVQACTVKEEKTTQATENQLITVGPTYAQLVHHLDHVKDQRSAVRPTSGELDKRLSEVSRIVESLAAYQDAAEQHRPAIDPKSQANFFNDIDDWLDELEDQIAEQPPGPIEVSPVAGLRSEQAQAQDAYLQSRIGELYKIFKLINDDRARYGVAPLKWDDQLAQHAREWVEQLAKMGRMEHAPREGRGIERENLAQGLPWWSVERMVEEWRGEEGNYVPGTFPNVARDGNWEKVAHWTQDISRLSQEIGCALARGSGFLWLDCRFSPGGNKDGEAFGPAIALEQPKLAAADVVPKTDPGKQADVDVGSALTDPQIARSIAMEPSYVTYDPRVDALSPNLEKAISTGAGNKPAPAGATPNVSGKAGGERTVQQHWPDFVGNVRIDQAWGSQATMDATHTINSPPPPTASGTQSAAGLAVSYKPMPFVAPFPGAVRVLPAKGPKTLSFDPLLQDDVDTIVEVPALAPADVIQLDPTDWLDTLWVAAN